MGQRLTGMTSRQDRFPVAAEPVPFARHGQSGAALVRAAAVHGEGRRRALLHPVDAHRGDQPRPGRHLLPDRAPSSPGGPASARGSSYGLGSENQDLPAFVVMISRGSGNPNDQPLYDRLWGSGFLPTTYQGVKFRSVGDPVLYLSNPAGPLGRGPAAHARRPGQARRDSITASSATPRS